MSKLIPQAVAIGSLFTKARTSHANSVKYLLDCGRALNAAKEAVGHGEWVFWLKDHQGELGFSESTAQRLMRGAKQMAKAAPARDLTEEEAIKVSRQIWNHEKEVPMVEDQTSPAIKRLRKMLEWSRGKSSAEVIAELDREEVAIFASMASEMAAWLLACTEELPKPPLRISHVA